MAKNKAKQKQLEEAATATVTQSGADAQDARQSGDKKSAARKFIFVGVSVVVLAGVGYYVTNFKTPVSLIVPAVTVDNEVGVTEEIPTAVDGLPNEMTSVEVAENVFPVELEKPAETVSENVETPVELTDVLANIDASDTRDLKDILTAQGYDVKPASDEEIKATEENSKLVDPLSANAVYEESEVSVINNEIQDVDAAMNQLEALTKPLLEMTEQSKNIMNSQSQKIAELSENIETLETELQDKTMEINARRYDESQLDATALTNAGITPESKATKQKSEVVLATLILDILEAYPRGSLNTERLTTAEFVASAMQTNPALSTALAQLKTVSNDGVVTSAALLNDIQTIIATKRYASEGMLNASEADTGITAFIKRHTSKWISIRKVEAFKVKSALNAELYKISSMLLSGQPKKALASLEIALNENEDLASLKTNNQMVELKANLVKHVIQAESLRHLKLAYQQNLAGGTH